MRRTPQKKGEYTFYYYDGVEVIEERDNANLPLRRYVCGRGIDQPLLMEDAGNLETYYYHCNALGSVSLLTDNTGLVVERYENDTYGTSTAFDFNFANPGPESLFGNPYRFTSRHFDSESGLYYYRARHYHPTQGRFLQRDPIGYEDKSVLNLYEYCQSNPSNLVDPTGLTTRIICAVVGAKQIEEDEWGHAWISVLDENGQLVATYGTWDNTGSSSGGSAGTSCGSCACTSCGSCGNSSSANSSGGSSNSCPSSDVGGGRNINLKKYPIKKLLNTNSRGIWKNQEASEIKEWEIVAERCWKVDDKKFGETIDAIIDPKKDKWSLTVNCSDYVIKVVRQVFGEDYSNWISAEGPDSLANKLIKANGGLATNYNSIMEGIRSEK